MENYLREVDILTTSVTAIVTSCKAIAVTDIIETSYVGLGTITSGMMIHFDQATGGTVAAGLSSSTEYFIASVDPVTSSFQVYATPGSSAVDISADSSSVNGDRLSIVRGGYFPCNDADYATLQIVTTTGYANASGNGGLRFIGSVIQEYGLDPDGRVTSSNPFDYLAYTDLTATSNPILGTTTLFASSGQNIGLYRLDVSGLSHGGVRTQFFQAGGINIKAKLYRED